MAELARIDLKPIIESIVNGNLETTTQLDARDGENRDRANHTGTQLASTISDFTTAVQSAETITTLGLVANVLKYTDEAGVETDLDLSLYLDDTNLARLVGGTLDGATGIATFTRDDATTFTVDMSSLLDDTQVTVNDTLISTSATEALSANMGKVLNDAKVDKVAGSNLVQDAKVTSYDNHIVDTSNPHGVTASQVGAYTALETENLLVDKQGILSEGEFVDGDKTKLDDTEITSQLDLRDVANRSVDNHTDGATNGVYTLVERTKLDGIEIAATADQTDAEIKLAYDNEYVQRTASNYIDGATKLDEAVDLLDAQAKVATDQLTKNTLVNGTAVDNRYDRVLSALDALEMVYTGSDLTTVRYVGDDDSSMYYRDVLSYTDGNLVTVKHYYATIDTITESGLTTLTYDGSDNLLTATYTEA